MAIQRQKSILLVAEWADARFQRSVAQYARAAEWHLNLDCVYSHELPWGWQGDGCIAMAGSPEILRFIESLQVPVVDITEQFDNEIPRIHEDNQAIGALAARYFLDIGFAHFAYYRTDAYNVATARETSFAREVEDAGFTVTGLFPKPANAPKAWAQRKAWLRQQLTELPKPLAVFCTDDRLAVSLVEACFDCGIRVPDEVAVLGVGDLEIACECSAVPISSVRIDYQALGYQAAELLDGLMRGDPPPESALLPPSGIEERRSTYTLAVEDPVGREAVRFILDHFSEPIGVSQMTEALGITRRQLTSATQRALGVPPARLLENIRLERACETLLATDDTVDGIARRTGLGTALRLQRIFQRRLGTSPGVWRKANRPLG
jgi:LacI family transcriptional regulator